MRFLAAAAIIGALMGTAYGQMPPLGVPMGGDKPQKPVDQAKENEYNKALRDLPNQKSADPWGNVRTEQPAPGTKKPAEKKTTGRTSKKGPAAPKDAAATPGKDAGTGKKTN